MPSEKIHLFDSYYYSEVSPEEFIAFYTGNQTYVYPNLFYLGNEVWMNQTEHQKQVELYTHIKSRQSLSLFIINEAQIIGWCSGWQLDEERFYLCDAGLFPEYQGKGILKAMLPIVLKKLNSDGYQKVISRHHTANSIAIAAMLKGGFVITGFEIDEQNGLMVVLSYIFNDKRSDIYKFRTGFLRPDADIKKLL
jgi:RimJ/RimL family protein N-acetyltransferase